MSQTLQYWVDDAQISREMPDANDLVVPGVYWGDHWALFTPAYWLSQLWMSGLDQQPHSPFQARGNLSEELVFCMLGGYGITAELATAAFEACRDAQLIALQETSTSEWREVLQRPLQINGRYVRYRFPYQKAHFLAGAMSHLRDHPIHADGGKDLRDSLLEINGVGPKTAGWVARNYLDTDDVAILDIHLVRAGLLCDLFSPTQRVARDYFTMESRFVEFCRALHARPAVLDCLIWEQMRAFGGVALDALRKKLCGGKPIAESGERPPTQMKMHLTG